MLFVCARFEGKGRIADVDENFDLEFQFRVGFKINTGSAEIIHPPFTPETNIGIFQRNLRLMRKASFISFFGI
jgi:hypothetical protein